ncbi:MAG: cytochrome c oxidase assembly factor Coa1 family protein [Verrucomicrobiales bacterium]|nr:cytochrome c oxidase assembly factor Coa1 family protein [Verrucomicrobiales bacterium]
MSEVPPLPEQKSNVGKIIGCGCAALLLLAIGGGALGVMGFTKLMKGNAPYTETIAAVQGNAEAIAALGEPIDPGFFPTGSININNGQGTVDFQIGVSGPKGSGTVFVKGEKPAGSSAWIYETRELKVAGQDQAISLP